ncbi:transcriptional regulator, TraR/DksA family [Arsukibacterium tuosuense]|uniref:Transcriptional regulator, TraR/DksA family n=1 Tax=Arsukibacterium tuosuense TaxID=1323745 RepID=A0A285J2T3_9GAMM|nr:DksA/TraR family C4-type zinc finger protein [Arsukibacterium tuosuense]SNY54177.1 transcriptional regulator, TraR/DksA family [Arsukibacterium tuosuense]
MAGGWSRDGAVQDQIDASVDDAVQRVRNKLTAGDSAVHCDECDKLIPEPRRKAVPGVRLCIACQAALEKEDTKAGGINRRGSKDSQLR